MEKRIRMSAKSMTLPRSFSPLRGLMHEIIGPMRHARDLRVYLQFGVKFHSRFSSREAAKNAKENAFYGFA
jgi:hypothetical protein